MSSAFNELLHKWESGPLPEIDIPQKEEPFDYQQYGYYEEDIHQFMKYFLNDPYIPMNEKCIFFEEFVIDYMTDKDYANSLYGQYVIFLNNSFYGIVKTIKESYLIGNPGDSRLLAQIKKNTDENLICDQKGNLHSVEYSKRCSAKHSGFGSNPNRNKNCAEKILILSQVTTDIVELQNEDKHCYEEEFKVHHQYKVPCSISHLNYLDVRGNNQILFSDLRVIDGKSSIKYSVIDTGAEIFNLNVQYAWDFIKKEFKDIYNKNNVLNRLIGAKRYSTIRCAGTSTIEVIYVFLIEPLFVSVGGLNPVPIYCFVVPIEPNDELYLISLDVLDQLTMIKSNFKEGHGIILMNQRKEFWT